MIKYNLIKFRIALVISILFATQAIMAQDDALIKKEQKITKIANDLVHEGNELLGSDKFVPAEMEYRRAISEQETNVAGNYNLGTSYYDKGNFDEGLFRLTEAIPIAKSKAEKHKVYHNIGNILMKKDLCKEAVEAYKNALRSDPTDDETRYNFVIAKECAEQQEDQQNDKNDKDKDKDKEEENKDEDNKDKEDNKDQENKDKKEGEDDKDEEGKPKDDKEKEKPGEGKDEKEKPQQPKPQPGQLSPQQIKSLLEAMNNQEQKVQEKLNAEKQKGVKIKTEKDW